MARPQPAFWVTLSADVRRDWSNRPLADEYFREGRIISGAVISRQASDKDGNWVRSRTNVELVDYDALVRILLDVDEFEYLMNRQGLFFIQDEDGRRAGDLPFHVFTGVAREPQVTPGMKASITFDDWIGSSLSPFNPAKKFPTAKLTKGMFPDLPNDLDGAVQRLICGIVSVYGEKDAQGTLIPEGAIIPQWVGKRILVDDGSEAPPTAVPVYLKPPVLSVSVTGSGASQEVKCAVVAFTRNGSTTISNVITVPNYPKDPSTSYYASWSWTTPADQAQYEDQIIRYGIYAWRTAQDTRWHMLDANVDEAAPPPNQFYVHNGEPPGDDNFGKMMYPEPPTVNTAQVGVTVGGSSGPQSFEWDVLFVCGHALNPDYIMNYYWPVWNDGGEVFSEPIPEGGFGVDILAPGKTGWPHPTPYVDILDSVTGKTYRCTILYVRGPRADKHREGAAYFSLDTCGMEDVGDGTGLPIRRGFFLLQHLMSEFVAANDGDGYLAGLWQGVPFFAIDPALPMIDTDSVQTAQAQSVEWIGGLGYVLDFVIDSESTVGALVQRFNVNLGSMAFTNTRGQFAVKVFDDTASATDGNEYRQGIEFNSLGRTEIAYNELENRIFYSLGKDPRTGTYSIRNRKAFAQDSHDQYKEWYDVTLEFDLSRDLATSDDVVARRLMRNKFRPLYQSYPTNLIHYRDDIGSQVRLTHKQGMGATGYNQRPFVVVGLDLDCRRGQYVARARDFRRVLASGMSALGDETDPNYTAFVLGDETSTSLPSGGGAMELR
jgi:hypothetical protein